VPPVVALQLQTTIRIVQQPHRKIIISQFQSHLLGGVAALASAFLWAVAAILFRRIGDTVSAMGINLAKGIVALVCLGILIIPTNFSHISSDSMTALALSGLIGICFGDTLYFLTLVRLGTKKTLLLGALIPVTTALLAVMFLGERVALIAWLGILMTITGVTFVLWQRVPENDNHETKQSGIFYGLLFVIANALGIIAAKVGVSDVPALEATFIRQVFAIAGLTFWGLMLRDLMGWVKPLKNPQLMKTLLLAAVIGAFLGTWLSIVALKYTHAAVAATLNSTSPLFILPLAVLMLKERISSREILGAFIAVSGVGLYFSTLYVG
jgi:drug/metabolite transporter (DMT)-like permease